MISASGGLVYHARALRYRARLWAPTRRLVSQLTWEWLQNVKPETLFLIGPSAGYLMHPHVLSRSSVRRVIVVDPDPIAEILFRMRFRKRDARSAETKEPLKIEWHRKRDLLPFFSEEPLAFAQFVAQEPEAAILFWGCLGQMELHREEFVRPRDQAHARLIAALAGRQWASLHDAYSGELVTEVSSPRRLFEGPPPAPHIAPDLELAELALVKAWTDHEMDWLRTGTESLYIPWQLAPKQLHWLEWLS